MFQLNKGLNINLKSDENLLILKENCFNGFSNDNNLNNLNKETDYFKNPNTALRID